MWCGPCLVQLPYALSFEKMHPSKISFAFLSLDRNIKDFKAAVKNVELKGEQYFLVDGFKSSFATLLGMKSIPRYVLLDKTFHLIKVMAPLPSNKTGFKKMIDDLE